MNPANIRIRQLDFPASEFAHFTYPRWREFLENEEPPGELLAVGVSSGDVKIGLALLSSPYEDRDDQLNSRRLLSIMVASRFRRCGVGGQLLGIVEKLAIESGTEKLVAYHSDQMSQKLAYEQLLKSRCWSGPQLHEFRLMGQADWAVSAKKDWYQLFRRVERNGFNLVPWQDIDEANRLIAKQLVELAPTFQIPSFENEAPDQSELCVAICQNSKLVGWIMGEWRPEENTAHYPNGYVQQEFQRQGWLIAGLIEICNRQAEIYGPRSLAIYETRGDNLAMQNFMKKRLSGRPSASTDHRFVCHKILGKKSSD